eukprot:9144595-Pyramimonas_sp.AAC.1
MHARYGRVLINNNGCTDEGAYAAFFQAQKRVIDWRHHITLSSSSRKSLARLYTTRAFRYNIVM